MELIKKEFGKKLADAISNCPKGKQFELFMALLFIRWFIHNENITKNDIDKMLQIYKKEQKQIHTLLKNSIKLCNGNEINILNSIEKNDNLLSEAIMANRYEDSLISSSQNYITPMLITSLGLALLLENPGDSICDLCCGTGSLFSHLYNSYYDVEHVEGVEKDISKATIALIRAEVSDADCGVWFCDMLLMEKKYDRIFANYPFKTKLNEIDTDFLKYVESGFDIKIHSSDWLYNTKIISLLKKGGKAIAICTNGSLCNANDSDIRKLFIENGYIEAVLTMPKNSLNNNNIETNIIVFSFNNKGVRFVDTKDKFDLYEKESSYDAEQLIDIINPLFCDIEGISKFVKKENLIKNKADLTPEYHLKKFEIKNGKKLSDFCTSITRGSSSNKKELSKYFTSTDSGYYYLKLQDIEDGEIPDNLQFLKPLPEKFNKYCIEEDDIVISKNGPVFKIAVASSWDGTILVSGNFYILRLDTNKIEPKYIQAYLESETGQVQLKFNTTGTTTNIISIKDLKKIQIPYPSKKKREEKIKVFEKSKEKIRDNKCEINRELRTLSGLF